MVLNHFRCIRLSVEIEARSRMVMPAYKGSTLRGALGMALKSSCCGARGMACETCPLRLSCVYVHLFETQFSLNEADQKRYRSAPRPLVLEIDRDGPLVLEPGQRWQFRLTVVGRAVQWLPFLVTAIQRMGKRGVGKGRGRFDLIRLVALDGRSAMCQVVYENGVLVSSPHCLDANGAVPLLKSGRDTFRLRFVTPLRLVFRGELVRVPEFHILAGHLARRLDVLERFHCGAENTMNIDEVIGKARQVAIVENHTRWYDWERYSHRQRRKMRLGGLVGEAVYQGDPTHFEPLLTIGTWVHVGKNTTFGLGRYELIV